MRTYVKVIMTFVVLGVLVACSTKKNTAMTRRVHAIKAHYNTYFNGQQAYLDGIQSQEQSNKDNFTDIIPLYMTTNPATAKVGKSNFDRAIEKCQKTIKQHSIVARPEWKNNKPKTQKDKIWLSQKEYNPFLYKAWFLMGESQFRKGEYMEAASTFAYMQNIYFSNPDIVAKARMLEAKCYAELEWFYDAEDLLGRAQRDSFPQNINHIKASVNADLMMRQQKYAEAIPNIITALKKEKRSMEKTRMYFLLGQLCHKVGDNKNAYKYYTKVIKRNPPYELEFNARIRRTECIDGMQVKQIIRNLQSMAKNSKNKDYLDQVYYAIGNVYLSQGDTTRAIWAYKDGVEKSTRNGIEKGVVLLHLGRLYWETEQFVKCQKCYADALSLFDKEKDEYEEIYDRSKILDALLPHSTAVELQDSLQALAKMDEKQRMDVIKKMIEELKEKEKKEERAKIDAEDASTSARNKTVNNNNNFRNNNNVANRNGQQALWYFYNPTAVEAGKKEFVRKWGKRQLADDWRRNNKTVLDDFNESVPTDSLANDSLGANAGAPDDITVDKDAKKDEKAEEYANDPHRPEYYLKDIPFTPEQMEESNKALVDGLFGSAVVYKDEMENFPLAERTFNRILKDFPDFEQKDEMYYNLFQLYSRLDKNDKAEEYRQKLIAEYPDNPHAQLIADPDFIYKGIHGKEIEDSIYAVAYDAFTRNDFATVAENNLLALKEYPNGVNRPRFMFIDALSCLETGDRDRFMTLLKEIVEKYPKSSVSELAGLYVKGLKEGRLLASGKFEMGSIWERRRGMEEGADSLSADSLFSREKNNEWLFAIAYERDSIDENQLLFEMAKYNFTKFSIRNFDISFDKGGDGIDMLQVRTFLNYDEAYIYLHRLMNDEEMSYKLQGLKCFIISEENLKMLMSKFSFSDYFQFYDENFDRIGHLQVDEDSLDSATDLPGQDEEEGEYDEEDDEYYDEEEGGVY